MFEPLATQDFHSVPNATLEEDGTFLRPIVPLRDQIIFPNIISPIILIEPQTRLGAEAAFEAQDTAIVISVPEEAPENLTAKHIPKIGVEVALNHPLRLPDETHSILAQGRRRVEIIKVVQTRPFLMAKVRIAEEINTPTRKQTPKMQDAVNLFKRLIAMSETIPDEVYVFALNADSAGWLADLILSTLNLTHEDRHKALTTMDGEKRLDFAVEIMREEVQMLELRDEISGHIQKEMDRSQREYYLREQIRVIQTELGEKDIFQREIDELRAKVEAAGLPEEVLQKATRELDRMGMMPSMAPEIGISHTYIDWLVSVPWQQRSEEQLDVKKAQKILNRDHYGLQKIKDRILEFIAVRKLAPEHRSSTILCFVGPPGVGKTSLGHSIAEALGREFVRISLGGVRDEAEIRGHRRTYIGALPGQIIQTMRRAGTINPVFMLDEIDKLGMDFRGDPASALLEILDPEQNQAFFDHYLDVPYDLSKVIFLTTANDIDPLPPALIDRLELIEFSGYTQEEKSAIARKFLIPKQLEANGLKDANVQFTETALQMLIHNYTYEAGVRNLNREIANVCRKIARQVAESKRHPTQITATHIPKMLGPAPFLDVKANDKNDVGLATGLAWTPFGGDVLTIEVNIMPGKNNLTMTGSLGEVMQESAQTAMSYLRSRADDFDIHYDDFENFDVHVHLPEGAVPKDGPSAGVTLATALISAFTERPVAADYAMTGEVTLRGKVLEVGGIKEKLLAARRAGLKKVIIPKPNERDLIDLSADVLKSLEIHPVETMKEVLDLVLLEGSQEERKIDRIRREKAEKDEDDEE